ncbi:MAG: carbohydrate kinase [Tunicatimonas sp.]
MPASESAPRIVCFGEMLYDHLPSGRFPGGAPMNVALHLLQQGVDTQFISSVGPDEAGESLREYLAERGLPTDPIQTDADHPTGKVLADTTQADDVKYDILHPVAWDFIEADPAAVQAVKETDLLLYGSLAARSATSRRTLEQLLALAPRTAFDVNLRAPHYDQETITTLLKQANLVKLNEEEFALLTQWYFGGESTENTVNQLAERFQLDTVCITRGAAGAELWHEGQRWEQAGFPVTVADTIGSGDAFLGTLLSKLLRGDPPPECLRYACAVGAYVASQPGATPRLNKEAIEKIARSDNPED